METAMSMGALTERETGFLSDEEKERIRAEEMVRYQAREDAKRLTCPRKTVLEKARDFANSAFGLWLLSTLVIGYGSYEFKNMQERSARRKEADRLEIELRHRLSHWRRVVANLSREVRETEEAGNDPWGLKFASRLRTGYRYIQTSESAFFSTYGNDNLQALFSGLQDKLRGLDEMKASRIDECLAKLQVLRKRCEDDYNDVPRPDSTQTHDLYYRQVKGMVDDVLSELESQPLSLWAVAEGSADKAQP
jgi:hypothetical protein